MKPGLTAALRQFVVPNGVLLAAAALLLSWKLAPVFAPPAGEFIGLAIAAAGVLLAWRLRSPRLLLMLTLLLVTEWAWLTPWSANGPGIRSALAVDADMFLNQIENTAGVPSAPGQMHHF